MSPRTVTTAPSTPEPAAAPVPADMSPADEKFVASYRRRAREPLPPPRLENWDWQRHARCRGMNPSIFFPTIDRGPRLARLESIAKQICHDCPVITACRRHALDVGERHGVWGGLTTTERALSQRRSPTA